MNLLSSILIALCSYLVTLIAHFVVDVVARSQYKFEALIVQLVMVKAPDLKIITIRFPV